MVSNVKNLPLSVIFAAKDGMDRLLEPSSAITSDTYAV